MISFDPILDQTATALNGATVDSLIFWTAEELTAWMTEAVCRLSRSTGAFVERNTSIEMMEDSAGYVLPGHITSIAHVSVGGVSLRAITAGELEAMSETWENDRGPVERFAPDVAGLRTLTLYPKPDAASTLALVGHAWALTGRGVSVPVWPEALGVAIKYATIAAARAKDGDGAAPDIARRAGAVAAIVEQAARGYWGGAQ